VLGSDYFVYFLFVLPVRYPTSREKTSVMATNFKLYINDEDIRRIRLEKPTWDSFSNKLHQLYPEYSSELLIKYKDEEGDLITITTSREWESMLQESDTSLPIKLFINETSQPRVSVVPVAEEKEEEEEKQVEEEVPPVAEEVVPAAVETGPDTPTIGQVPAEVVLVEKAEAEQPTTTKGEQAHPLAKLETDLEEFLESLQRQACALLNPDQNEALKKAKEFLQGLVPDQNPAILQDLAGVVDGVKRAFSNGYDNLRGLPELNDLLDLFSLGKEEDPKKYVSQHETLEAMGFVNVETNLGLLVKYKGNMQRVVDALLAEQ